MSLEAFHNLPYYEYPTCISVADIFCLTLLTCLTIVHADCQIVGGLTTEVRMPGKHSIRSVAGILFCLVVFAAASLFGQSGSSGLVTGVVTDPSGAAIVGATVTLQQQGTGATQTAHTDADGRYVFPSVNPANYTLTFAAQGFVEGGGFEELDSQHDFADRHEYTNHYCFRGFGGRGTANNHCDRRRGIGRRGVGIAAGVYTQCKRTDVLPAGGFAQRSNRGCAR